MSDGHTWHSTGGDVTVTVGALEELVVRAVESVDGLRVRRRRALEIEIADGRVRVAAELVARYGLVLPDAAREAQARTADALHEMCGLDVDAIELAIEELVT